METFYLTHDAELYHYGILGMKWGVRRYQNPDGSLTAAGRQRYGSIGTRKLTRDEKKELKSGKKELDRLLSNQRFYNYAQRRANKEYEQSHKRSEKALDRAVNGKDKSGNRARKALLEYHKSSIKAGQKKFYDSHSKETWEKTDKLVKDLTNKYGSKRVPSPSSRITKDGRRILNTLNGKDMLANVLLGAYASYIKNSLNGQRYFNNANEWGFNYTPKAKKKKNPDGSVDVEVRYNPYSNAQLWRPGEFEFGETLKKRIKDRDKKSRK